MRLSDFESAEKFGDVLFEQLQVVYQTEWSKPETVLAIQRSVEEIYRYYRLKDDASVIPDAQSPIQVRFGGPDLRSLNFFNKLDHFYFSKYLNNSEPGLKRYFADEWVAKGGRSVVDLTAEQIEDIRAALGDRLKNVNDVNLERIVRGATVRARNWAHLHRMREGRIELARIVAVIDSRTSEICRFLDGKFMRVGVAAAAVDRFSAMEPGDFAKEMYESPAAKGLRAANNDAAEVEKFFKGKLNSKGVLDDSLLAAGYGLPPYHVSCRTRLVGEVIAEADAEAVVETPAPEPLRPPEFPADPEALTVVRKLGGSTGAELVEDAFGQRFVRKRGANPEHLREEVTADSAYRALGVPVPAARLYETSNGPVKLAKFIEGQPLSALGGVAREAAEAELRKHFAADALLGNWDVIGLSADNVLVANDGQVWRIDNGGSLRFRAMGARKTAEQFNKYPLDLWTMRDRSVNPSAAKVFEKLDLYQLQPQLQELARQRAALLQALPKELRAVLADRLDQLGNVAEIANTFQGDQWKASYADGFAKHVIGLRHAGIVDRLPKELRGTANAVIVEDENGKPFDDLRGANSIVNALDAYMQRQGTRQRVIRDFVEAQAGSSWSPEALAVKRYLVNQRNLPDSAYWWYPGKLAISQQALVDFEAQIGGSVGLPVQIYHAFNYELLGRVKMPHNDQRRRLLRLIRTENPDVLSGAGVQVGTRQRFKRGPHESSSMFQSVSAVAGNAVTVQWVPHHRATFSYLLGKSPGKNYTGFLNDRENEMLFLTEGIEFEYLGVGVSP